MSRASYYAHQAQGICPDCGLRPRCLAHHPDKTLPLQGMQSRCASCLEKAWRATRRYRGLPLESTRASMSDPPLLAHCGTWHEVSAVPFIAPCCGTTLFEEA